MKGVINYTFNVLASGMSATFVENLKVSGAQFVKKLD